MKDNQRIPYEQVIGALLQHEEMIELCTHIQLHIGMNSFKAHS